MKKKIADLWIARLRDPNSKQAFHVLKNNGGMCCLGHLCDLYMVTRDISWKTGVAYNRRCFECLGETRALPTEVMHWAGINDRWGSFGSGGYDTLACLNDGTFNKSRQSFSQIADFIEHNWEKL